MGTLIALLSSGDPVAALLAGVLVTLALLAVVVAWIAFEVSLAAHREARAKKARNRFRF